MVDEQVRQSDADTVPDIINGLIRRLVAKGRNVSQARVLVLGITCGANKRDVRHSRALRIVEGLRAFVGAVDVHDPIAVEAPLALIDAPDFHDYDLVVKLVAHDVFKHTDR